MPQCLQRKACQPLSCASPLALKGGMDLSRVNVHMVGLSVNCAAVLVQEEEQWLFLSRKTSLRKRSLKHLVDEAHCLHSGATHHNITGQYNRKECFLSKKKDPD